MKLTAWLGVVLSFVIGIYGGLTIEADIIATHFNAQGVADGFSPKWQGMMMIPLVSLVSMVVIMLLPKMNTRKQTADLSMGNIMVATTAIATVWLLALVQLFIYLSAIGADFDITFYTTLGVAVLLIVMGNVIPKIRPNQFVGIRTPWTLDSDKVWYHTHRMAGPLFIAAGVLSIVVVFVRSEWGVWAMVGSALTVSVVSVGYSWWKFAKLKAEAPQRD